MQASKPTGKPETSTNIAQASKASGRIEANTNIAGWADRILGNAALLYRYGSTSYKPEDLHVVITSPKAGQYAALLVGYAYKPEKAELLKEGDAKDSVLEALQDLLDKVAGPMLENLRRVHY